MKLDRVFIQPNASLLNAHEYVFNYKLIKLECLKEIKIQ